jgi:hypothetical protein
MEELPQPSKYLTPMPTVAQLLTQMSMESITISITSGFAQDTTTYIPAAGTTGPGGADVTSTSTTTKQPLLGDIYSQITILF